MNMVLSAVFFLFGRKKKKAPETFDFSDAIHEGLRDLGREMGYRPSARGPHLIQLDKEQKN
jgi:phage terminase small subunit